jgi:TPR repeat protein
LIQGFQLWTFFLCIISGSVLLHRQLSPPDLQQLLAWYKIRDLLLGQNNVEQDIKKALELASVCEHPNAVWLTKLFAGYNVASREEARRVFLGCENDGRALCFAGVLGRRVDEVHRAADFGDAFAEACMAMETRGEESFRWAGKSAAQGERDGFYYLGDCYRHGIGCDKDVEGAKEKFLVASKLGHVGTMDGLGGLLDKVDPQRFFGLEELL